MFLEIVCDRFKLWYAVCFCWLFISYLLMLQLINFFLEFIYLLLCKIVCRVHAWWFLDEIVPLSSESFTLDLLSRVLCAFCFFLSSAFLILLSLLAGFLPEHLTSAYLQVFCITSFFSKFVHFQNWFRFELEAVAIPKLSLM